MMCIFVFAKLVETARPIDATHSNDRKMNVNFGLYSIKAEKLFGRPKVYEPIIVPTKSLFTSSQQRKQVGCLF
jgi:hypothetical protein